MFIHKCLKINQSQSQSHLYIAVRLRLRPGSLTGGGLKPPLPAAYAGRASSRKVPRPPFPLRNFSTKNQKQKPKKENKEMKIPTSERPKLDETLDEHGFPPITNGAEFMDWGKKLKAWYDGRIIFDRSNNTCTLLFETSYEIGLDEIKSVRDILEWTLHLLEEGRLEKDDVIVIIERIAKFKKIEIYR